MSEFFQKRPKKEPIELQLTAMIDVFSMIVIFLIFGTVFGAADIVIPAELRLPQSLSREGLESAPRIAIVKNEIIMGFYDKHIQMSDLRSPSIREELKTKLNAALTSFVEKKKKSKESVFPLNLIADRNTPYADIFDATIFFRELGFNTILFVADGERKSR